MSYSKDYIIKAAEYCASGESCVKCPLYTKTAGIVDYKKCRTLIATALVNVNEERDMLELELNALKPCVKQPTQDEIECMRVFAKAGYGWFAKDDYCGNAHAYKSKPYKKPSQCLWSTDNDSRRLLPMKLSFLSWEDDEPYYFDEEELTYAK